MARAGAAEWAARYVNVMLGECKAVRLGRGRELIDQLVLLPIELGLLALLHGRLHSRGGRRRRAMKVAICMRVWAQDGRTLPTNEPNATWQTQNFPPCMRDATARRDCATHVAGGAPGVTHVMPCQQGDDAKLCHSKTKSSVTRASMPSGSLFVHAVRHAS